MRALTNATLRSDPSGATRGTTSPTVGVSTTTGVFPPTRSSSPRRSPRSSADGMVMIENERSPSVTLPHDLPGPGRTGTPDSAKR